MKKIIYFIGESGMDGMQKEKILFASFDEQETKTQYNQAKYKNWYRLGEKIIDVEKETKQTLAKLNGVDKLLLNIKNEVKK